MSVSGKDYRMSELRRRRRKPQPSIYDPYVMLKMLLLDLMRGTNNRRHDMPFSKREAGLCRRQQRRFVIANDQQIFG